MTPKHTRGGSLCIHPKIEFRLNRAETKSILIYLIDMYEEAPTWGKARIEREMKKVLRMYGLQSIEMDVWGEDMDIIADVMINRLYPEWRPSPTDTE